RNLRVLEDAEVGIADVITALGVSRNAQERITEELSGERVIHQEVHRIRRNERTRCVSGYCGSRARRGTAIGNVNHICRTACDRANSSYGVKWSTNIV